MARGVPPRACDNRWVPDWTYHPLAPIASKALGERRTQRLAMQFLASLITRAGGAHWIPRVFDHPAVPQEWCGRFGASVPITIAREAIVVLPVQGATVVEVGPVGANDVATLRDATTDRNCTVIARVATPDVAALVRPYVDAVTDETSVVRLTDPDVSAAVGALGHPDATVLATPEVLLAAGPGWFNRVIEAATPTAPAPGLGSLSWNPVRWPGWFWGVLVGVGLIVAGLGAAAIALGPVLLWYDRDYLGASVTDLRTLNGNLVGFLIHDRLTMAGNMIGIGVLYAGMSWGGLRLGRTWARNALLVSGLFAFGTYFYFLSTGFVEPLHTLVVLILFPMFLAAVWNRPEQPRWPRVPDGPESQRRRALWGQLLMIAVGAGLTVAGLVISTVGLTTVFVPTDLSFLGTQSHHLQSGNSALVPFIAHDRAGFGGALIGAGLAVLLISLWGWRRGERWVWWSLLVGCAFGTVPVLAIHFSIGYTHFEHLAPVYVLVAVTVVALTMARPYLTARSGLGRDGRGVGIAPNGREPASGRLGLDELRPPEPLSE